MFTNNKLRYKKNSDLCTGRGFAYKENSPKICKKGIIKKKKKNQKRNDTKEIKSEGKRSSP